MPPRFPEVALVWNQVTGEDISGGTALWVDSFDNSAGLVDRYRRGRVLLAGDAAHWHMPIGGQELLLLGGHEIAPLYAVLSELIGLDQVRAHLARAVSGLDNPALIPKVKIKSLFMPNELWHSRPATRDPASRSRAAASAVPS